MNVRAKAGIEVDHQVHSVTMWDYSWLLRRQGAEAEYADVNKVLDELAERGYDVVRIDAFPHWIAAGRDGESLSSIHSTAQPPGFMWGNHSDVTVEPRAALSQFLAGLADRGLTAGLSTWLTPDKTGRGEQVRTPQDLARIWIETLRFIHDQGLLHVVQWVDLCNEWPAWTPGIWPDVFGSIDSVFGMTEPFTDQQIERLDRFQLSLVLVREEFPGIPLTLSYYLRSPHLPLRTDLQRLASDEFDFAEPHIWLAAASPKFVERTAWRNDWNDDVTVLTDHERLIRRRYAAEREDYLAELAVALDEWQGWAAERGLPLWTTEGWASVGWSPDLVPGWDGWDYVKDAGAAAIGLAIDRNWKGICTSNFSQPHHVGMWADVEWHQAQTSRIRNASPVVGTGGRYLIGGTGEG
jgi:hypothetical protein